jgi:hypothetical protein
MGDEIFTYSRDDDWLRRSEWSYKLYTTEYSEDQAKTVSYNISLGSLDKIILDIVNKIDPSREYLHFGYNEFIVPSNSKIITREIEMSVGIVCSRFVIVFDYEKMILNDRKLESGINNMTEQEKQDLENDILLWILGN